MHLRPARTLVLALPILAACVITDAEGDTDTDGGTSGQGSTGSTTSDTSTSTTSGASASSETGGSGSTTSEATDGTGESSTGSDTDSANARCGDFCDALVAAGCDNNATVEGCLVTCQALTSSEVCDPVGNAYFDCVEGTTIACDGQGNAFAEGCGLAYLEGIGCAVTEDPNPTIVMPCEDYCGNIADQMCPSNQPEDDCNVSCRWFGATGTRCDDEWLGYLDCANAASWSCLLGFAVPAMCGTEYGAYWDCINNPE